jgi:Tfp pilus assembly protein PilV
MKVTAQTSPASARLGAGRSARAFTILEVMVAAMVMALTLTSSLQVLGYGLRAVDTARCTTLAGQILQSQMEKLRLLTWSQLTGAGGPMSIASFTPDVTSVGTSNQISNFTCTQSITYDPAAVYGNTMLDITLTAQWRGIDGRTHSRSYSTLYGQNGISDFFYTAH